MQIDTEEVAGSSPVVPTIFIYGIEFPKPFHLTQVFTQQLLNHPGSSLEDCVEHQVLSRYKLLVVGLRVAV